MSIEKAKYQAVKYLSFRSRTVQEVCNYLQKKQYSQQIIEEVIKYLKAQSYLDDDKFCQLWIESRSRLKPKGKKGLYYELKNKGIDNYLIEKNINEYFNSEVEIQIANELVSKKLQMFDNNKEKILADLYRRGFSNFAIQKIISNLELSNSN